MITPRERTRTIYTYIRQTDDPVTRKWQRIPVETGEDREKGIQFYVRNSHLYSFRLIGPGGGRGSARGGVESE